jgi:hypothetical protein
LSLDAAVLVTPALYSMPEKFGKLVAAIWQENNVLV